MNEKGATQRDIVERLRSHAFDRSNLYTRLTAEAADEIERLRVALRPFAEAEVVFTCNCSEPALGDCPFFYSTPNVAFEAAREALDA